MDFHNKYHLRDLLSREMFEIYFLLGLRKLAIAMIAIFLPLYLLVELNLGLPKTLFFFVTMSLASIPSMILALFMIKKKGTKHVLIYSTPFLVLGMLSLIFLQQKPELYLIPAIFFGLDMALFWIAFHIDAAISTKRKQLGKESALITVVTIFGSIFGPLLGGLILKFSNFTVLFLIALTVLLISIIPLLFSKEIFPKTSFTFKEMLKKEHKKYFLAFFAQGVRSRTITIFWPILIFSILGGYLSLGVYGTIASLFLAIFGFFIGQISDQMKRSTIIKTMGVLDAILWVGRLFITSILSVFSLGILGGMAYIGVGIPLLTKSYTMAKKETTAEFVVFRELSIRIGAITVVGIALFLGSIKAPFIVSAIVSLFYIFI
jgi:MFS family permease